MLARPHRIAGPPRDVRWRHTTPAWWQHKFKDVPWREARLDPDDYSLIEHIRVTGQIGSGAVIPAEFKPWDDYKQVFVSKDRKTAEDINRQLRLENPRIEREVERHNRAKDREQLEEIKARAAERKAQSEERKRRAQELFFARKRQEQEFYRIAAERREEQRLRDIEWLEATKKIIGFDYESLEYLALDIAKYPGIPSADTGMEIAIKMIEACDRDKTVLDEAYVDRWMANLANEARP